MQSPAYSSLFTQTVKDICDPAPENLWL